MIKKINIIDIELKNYVITLFLNGSKFYQRDTTKKQNEEVKNYLTTLLKNEVIGFTSKSLKILKLYFTDKELNDYNIIIVL